MRRDTSKERASLMHAGRLHWMHWTVVILSGILTLFAWYVSKQQIEEKVSNKFEREALQVVDLVKERMAVYENVLWSAVAFMDVNKSVNHQQWKIFADSLNIDQVYPGINGIGIILNVSKADFPDYMRRQLVMRPDYTVHPEHGQHEHWPITYVEPVSNNAKAVGLDMAFESNRYQAILKARDSGAAQLTGPIVLVQDSKKTPGFLFYAPYYAESSKPETIEERQRSIVGVTYAPFIMYKLMQGTLRQENRHVNIKISDGSDVLFDDQEYLGAISPKKQPMFRKVVDVPLYGRTWTFDIHSNQQFDVVAKSNQPYYILFGGILIDGLLLALFLTLTRANKNAVQYANAINKDLMLKSDHLEKSNRDLEQFAYVASHDLKAPLRGISNLCSWLSEDLEGVFQGKEAFHEELQATVKDYIAQMHKRSDRLATLLESILSYSRVGAENHEKVAVSVEKSLQEINQLLNVDNKFTITNDPLPELLTEKVPFEIVLRNLISNAIKHHDRESGHIHISATLVGEFYEFSVADDGPGIQEQYHEKIFELFSTLKSRDQVEASGMGLATILKIVNLRNGKIWVEKSADERGATFKFTWPIEDDV